MSLRAIVEKKVLAKVFALVTARRDNFVPFEFVCENLRYAIYNTDYDLNGADRRWFQSELDSMPLRSDVDTRWGNHYDVRWSEQYGRLLELERKLRYKDVVRGRINPRRHSPLAKLVSHMANQLTPVHERLAELHLRALESNRFGDICGNSQQPKLQQLLNRYYFDSSQLNLRAYLIELEEVIDSLRPKRKHQLRVSLDEFESYLLIRDLLEEEL